eukprot:SAG11_NODE_141_length_14934_cov_4.821503_12_plen_183_part_00
MGTPHYFVAQPASNGTLPPLPPPLEDACAELRDAPTAAEHGATEVEGQAVALSGGLRAWPFDVLVAADGSRSVVRRQAEVGFEAQRTILLPPPRPPSADGVEPIKHEELDAATGVARPISQVTMIVKLEPTPRDGAALHHSPLTNGKAERTTAIPTTSTPRTRMGMRTITQIVWFAPSQRTG